MAPWVTTGRFVCWFVSCNANHMMQCRNRNRNFMMFAGIFGTKCALQRWAYDRVKRTHCHSSAVTSVIRVLYGVRRTLYYHSPYRTISSYAFDWQRSSLFCLFFSFLWLPLNRERAVYSCLLWLSALIYAVRSWRRIGIQMMNIALIFDFLIEPLANRQKWYYFR